mmetsp:Transcript_11212/g.15650  ORF Transcript_11212/g.15650 Transcript_11212/m.15650 type:complete len:570 (-) Transcript_11212:322-2031(-)|eukprot:CAMPEP_0184479050 /NCGR_PEP_ID=MMETSP0113_2-20130426/912_1 /TAXON_ID=91329 /ORGANISM="Norrisiella sphaerica, Strain BC52" /LENGTH=569 /DNA_ID=CAMNT_0026857039 /DNA_START=969 /DNA_END=2678 /DNA_ORIENTATION=-
MKDEIKLLEERLKRLEIDFNSREGVYHAETTEHEAKEKQCMQIQNEIIELLKLQSVLEDDVIAWSSESQKRKLDFMKTTNDRIEQNLKSCEASTNSLSASFLDVREDSVKLLGSLTVGLNEQEKNLESTLYEGEKESVSCSHEVNELGAELLSIQSKLLNLKNTTMLIEQEQENLNSLAEQHGLPKKEDLIVELNRSEEKLQTLLNVTHNLEEQKKLRELELQTLREQKLRRETDFFKIREQFQKRLDSQRITFYKEKGDMCVLIDEKKNMVQLRNEAKTERSKVSFVSTSNREVGIQKPKYNRAEGKTKAITVQSRLIKADPKAKVKSQRDTCDRNFNLAFAAPEGFPEEEAASEKDHSKSKRMEKSQQQEQQAKIKRRRSSRRQLYSRSKEIPPVAMSKKSKGRRKNTNSRIKSPNEKRAKARSNCRRTNVIGNFKQCKTSKKSTPKLKQPSKHTTISQVNADDHQSVHTCNSTTSENIIFEDQRENTNMPKISTLQGTRRRRRRTNFKRVSRKGGEDKIIADPPKYRHQREVKNVKEEEEYPRDRSVKAPGSDWLFDEEADPFAFR